MTDDVSFPEPDQSNAIDLATQIVAAYVSNNRVPPGELPVLLSSMHAAVSSLGRPAASVEAEADKLTPAQVRKSIRPDALISFIDGKSYKTLKRHLTKNGLDPVAYRARFGLPKDYPMVAASYAAQRSELARGMGLGYQRRRHASKAAEDATSTPKTRGRKKAAAAE